MDNYASIDVLYVLFIHQFRHTHTRSGGRAFRDKTIYNFNYPITYRRYLWDLFAESPAINYACRYKNRSGQSTYRREVRHKLLSRRLFSRSKIRRE